jgi:hypothetical protein
LYVKHGGDKKGLNKNTIALAYSERICEVSMKRVENEGKFNCSMWNLMSK